MRNDEEERFNEIEEEQYEPEAETSAELAARFEVDSLEDAYLALVGRKELSRSHAEVAAP